MRLFGPIAEVLALNPCITPKLRRRPHMRRLVLENTRLRAQNVEGVMLSQHKDEAHREYVNLRIAQINAAIRATNGPRPGETAEAYSSRLVAANTPTQARVK